MNILVRLALICTLVFWASAFIGIRIGLEGYSPGALALFRFLVASLGMLIFYCSVPQPKKIPWFKKIELMLIGVGAIGIYNLCLNYGEQSVSAGIASFVIGLIPVFTICLSVFMLKEKLHPTVWIGVAVSFIGLILILLGEHNRLTAVTGIAVILISSLMGGIYNISQRRYLKEYHPIAITAWVLWGGTLLLGLFFPDLYHQFQHITDHASLAAIYMGIFPAAIAYACWSYVLSHLSAAQASVYLYTLPILSTLMGMVILAEYPSGLSLFGGVIALCGALIASRPGFLLKIKDNFA